MITELLENLAYAIANDERIKSYCTEKFSKAETIMIGLEPETDPDSDNYPLIALTNTNSDRGDGMPEEKVEIGITVIVKTEATAPIVQNGITIYKWLGFMYVEHLRRLVENSILNTTGLGWKISFSGQSSFFTYYPQFCSVSILTLKRSKSKSSGRGFSEE